MVATTDVDDPVLLSAMFADPRLRAARSVVAGQFLGILALTGASEPAAPAEWVALPGLLPLALGVRLPLAGDGEEEDWAPPQLGAGAQVLAVADVTVASGADNLAVWIPLFAANPGALPALALVFLVLTGLLCAASFESVSNLTRNERSVAAAA